MAFVVSVELEPRDPVKTESVSNYFVFLTLERGQPHGSVAAVLRGVAVQRDWATGTWCH